MAGVNKVIILGNLGADPEVRTMPNGNPVTNISVATSETWKDRNTGENRELTEWHRIIFFGRQAEVIGQYFRKGSKIYVEGRIQTRKWQDQNGADRYSTEIIGNSFTFVDSRSDREATSHASTQYDNYAGPEAQGNFGASAPTSTYPSSTHLQKQAPQVTPVPMDDFEDDIPF